MGYSVHVVKPNDFVRMDAYGRVDLEASRRVMAEVARTCQERGLDLALIDVRDLYSDLRPTDVYALVRSFHEMGFQSNHRLAVLHRYNSTEKAEFFAMCAADQGFDVRAFDDFEQAVEWLNSVELVELPKRIRIT